MEKEKDELAWNEERRKEHNNNSSSSSISINTHTNYSRTLTYS